MGVVSNKKTLEEIRQIVGEFSDRKFGKERPFTSPLYHLKEEVDEVIESGKITEFADCLLLLLDGFNKKYRDLHTDELLNACFLKMEKNEKREWSEPDKNGVFHHKPKK